MVKEDIRRRIKRCGVCEDTLKLGVNCGAYPNMEAALDRLDSEHPLGNRPDYQVKISRMIQVNDDIDAYLFDLVQSTSAWTWVDDYKFVLVLLGPEHRGKVLHHSTQRPINFSLELQPGKETRFLRFWGDIREERMSKKGKPLRSLLWRVARKLRISTEELRDMLECLVRTCDEPGWNYAEFPFIYPGRQLDPALKLLKYHGLMVHEPPSCTLP